MSFLFQFQWVTPTAVNLASSEVFHIAPLPACGQEAKVCKLDTEPAARIPPHLE